MKVRQTRYALLAAALQTVAVVAFSETSAVSPTGFLVTHRHQVRATPQQLYEAIGRIGRVVTEI